MSPEQAERFVKAVETIASLAHFIETTTVLLMLCACLLLIGAMFSGRK